MPKQIIATTLSGLFIKSEPWDNAHILWFQDASEKLNDQSVNDWANKPDYFKGVDEVMERLYPDLSDKQRTKKARELFFESVCKYIEKHPDVVNQERVDYFKSLKQEYQIALITTNTQQAVNTILSSSNLQDLFDIIETSLPEEKDDKAVVFNRFIRKQGKPIIYIGGGRKDSYDYCAEHNIPRVFANLEGSQDLEGVDNVYDLNELKAVIQNLSN